MFIFVMCMIIIPTVLVSLVIILPDIKNLVVDTINEWKRILNKRRTK